MLKYFGIAFGTTFGVIFAVLVTYVMYVMIDMYYDTKRYQLQHDEFCLMAEQIKMESKICE